MARKMACLVVAAILFAASALLLGSGLEDQTQSSSGDKTQTVLIKGFAFNPSNLTVEQGTNVISSLET